MSISIHTVDVRENIMPESIRDYFGLTPDNMFCELQNMAANTVDILKKKRINYDELRSALVPKTDRYEAGFIFNTRYIESSWYGLEVMKQLLPHLEHKSNNSVLCGDLISDNQEFVFSILQESLILSKSLYFVHRSLLYCVYINNLSESAIDRLNNSLSNYTPYVGYIPASYSSRAKIYLSLTLTNSFLKHGKKIIMGHEDDRSNDENVNIIGYPFEDYGMSICSLQSMYFDLLLSYKIERPVFRGFESDTEISLNAISKQIFPIDDFDIEIEDAKHKYLKSAKCGKLEKAGIESLSKNELANLIRSKVFDSYIYNLSYLPEHNVSKFNVMLEIPKSGGGYPTRVVAALEYKPAEKKLRVITMH